MRKLLTIGCVLGMATLASAQLEISLGVRETGGTGPAGSNGGSSGSLEWVDLDGQVLYLNGAWQQFTFDFDADPITPFTGNGVIDGSWGVIEHIRIKNTGGVTGPINLWFDDITNTTTTNGAVTFADFEDYADGTEVMFQEPSFSGSTGSNVAAGSTSGVDNSVSLGGSASYKARFAFVDGTTTRWVRYTTFSTGQPLANALVQFDDDGTVSFWMRGIRGNPGTFFTSGAGCASPPLALSTRDLANVGAIVEVTCTNLPAATTAASLLFGSATQNTALDPIGMPGCALLVDALFADVPMTLALPDATLDIGIFCDAGSIGNVAYLQAAGLAIGENALGVVLSNRAALTIGAPPDYGADECASAPAIGDGFYSGDNLCATDSPVSASCGTIGNDVWYAYTATCTGSLTASLCEATGGSADFDTVMAVFDGSCGTLNQLACNDDGCGVFGGGSQVSALVTAGSTYYIVIGGYFGDRGSYTLSVSCAPPPPGEECSTAIAIGDGTVSGSNLGATRSPVTGSCGLMGADLWYAYTASCTGTATASLCTANGGSADFDSVLAAFSGDCTTLTQIVCNDDFCSRASEISFAVTAGTVYYIAVGGFNGATGNYTLAVGCQ